MVARKLFMQDSKKAYAASTTLLVAICLSYGIEMTRSIHGLVFMHDLLNTSMGALLVCFGVYSIVRQFHSQKYRIALGVSIAEILVGIVLVAGAATASQVASNICNVLISCLCAASLLYFPSTKRAKFMNIVMIGMAFVMIGFYADFHTTVFSLTQFRISQ